MNNKELLEYSKDNPDYFIDKSYSEEVNHVVITQTNSIEPTLLMKTNDDINDYITTIKCLMDHGHSIDDDDVVKLINKILDKLKVTDSNFTPFCQYFLVHNVSYSMFQELSDKKKMEFLKYIIQEFIKNRFEMYNSHGYTATSLQVVSDNYSHKRKSAYGAHKIERELEQFGIHNFIKEPGINHDSKLYCMLADKDGKEEFKKIIKELNIELKQPGKRTIKYPDAFIRIGDDYFIVEHKHMKEGGGDQDKTIESVIEFISKTPEFEKLHYVSYVDGTYLSDLFSKAKIKTKLENKSKTHLADINNALETNNGNYFVNSNGFKKMINLFYEDYKKINS